MNFSDMHYYSFSFFSELLRSAPLRISYILLSFCLLITSGTLSGEEYVTLIPEAVCSSTTLSLSTADVISFVLHYPFRQLVPFSHFLLSVSIKIVPCSHGENAFDRSGILVLIAVLLIVERNVIAVLRRATAACKLCNIRIAQTACLEHLSLLMFSAENIE